MILPLPVPKQAAKDAVQFINLDSYPDFFTDLYKAFPRPRTVSRGLTALFSEPLEVVSVGSFEASFVPTISDFQRLDARFRLPSSIWQSLPAYQNYGFAVFKLKRGDLTVHPMAFEFPTIEPTRLFFPTLHIHDGKVHPSAEYNHLLYCQITEEQNPFFSVWDCSRDIASRHLKMEATQGIVDPDRHCYKVQIDGVYRNQDCWM